MLCEIEAFVCKGIKFVCVNTLGTFLGSFKYIYVQPNFFYLLNFLFVDSEDFFFF